MIFISIMLIMIMMIINYDIYINHVDNDNNDIYDNVNDDNKDLMLVLNPVTCSLSLIHALSLILFRTFLYHFVLL